MDERLRPDPTRSGGPAEPSVGEGPPPGRDVDAIGRARPNRLGNAATSIGAVRALAHATFLEAVRDRVLYLLFFFGIFVFGASRLLAPLALGEGKRITVDLGFTAISAFGCLAVIFVGHQLIFREVERRTLFFLFARPLRRAEFIWGKYLGLLAVLGVAVAAMGGMLAAVLRVSGYAFGWSFLGALALSLGEMVVLAALAVLFASVTSPVLAGLITLAAWIIGHGSGSLQDLLRSIVAPGAAAAIHVVGWIIPRLDLFHDVVPVLSGHGYPAIRLFLAFTYAGAYAGAALVGAALVLRRRELAP